MAISHAIDDSSRLDRGVEDPEMVTPLETDANVTEAENKHNSASNSLPLHELKPVGLNRFPDKIAIKQPSNIVGMVQCHISWPSIQRSQVQYPPSPDPEMRSHAKSPAIQLLESVSYMVGANATETENKHNSATNGLPLHELKPAELNRFPDKVAI